MKLLIDPAHTVPIAAATAPLAPSPSRTSAAGPFPSERRTFEVPGLPLPDAVDVDAEHPRNDDSEVDRADEIRNREGDQNVH